MKPKKAEKLFVLILPVAGFVCALAVLPMLMPIAWAQPAHAANGLGELPGEPVVEYLVRGISAMCPPARRGAGTVFKQHAPV